MNIEQVKEFVESRTFLGSDEHIQVREVWDGRYRVNIWQYDPNRITKSFFVRASGDQLLCQELGA